MPESLVAGLDIGSSKTAVVIAEASGSAERPQVKILGVGQARTGGIRRDVVTDIEATTGSVRKAVKEAELMSGAKVQRLFTGIAGEHVGSVASPGMVAVSGSEVDRGDVERVQEVARATVIPTDRELLHAIPQSYVIDGVSRDNPVGMTGTRLEAEVYLVTGALSAGQNVRKSVSRAGYEVAALVLEPLAASLAVLSEDEKEIGVALVDLGGGTTEMMVFHDRKVRHLASLPWSGANVPSDIAKGLSLPVAEAVRAKERWGVALANSVDPNETLQIAGPAPVQTREIARDVLAHVIEERVDEIFGLVKEQLERSGIADKLGSGLVLTGGGASLQGVLELAERSFPLPVRGGVPGEGLGGLVDSVRRPKFATATCLALYAARQTLSHSTGGAAAGAVSVGGAVRWVRDWLADFF
ncbi:cell division protein FtsA [soil metagenome]